MTEFADARLMAWEDKYRFKQPDGTSDEFTPADTNARVGRAIYSHDTGSDADVACTEAIELMDAEVVIPGGRVIAGAGTGRAVTLINCFVSQTIDDSMEGILAAFRDAALTQQQGGGIGMDFSTIRPTGAIVKRTGSVASGPLPFMDMWHAMCATVMSSGSRRGAMMGVLADWHPDLPAFIDAKHTPGRLTNFNVSVLISDAFMKAVSDDAMWALGFHVPRADNKHIYISERDGIFWYVYQEMPARELWGKILRSTYEYAEPGVIFIDRVNALNNLSYCETIRATNPCGEQGLPPYGDCNLIAINLARVVNDRALLRRAVRCAVRFGDNVIEATNYPLAEHRVEAYDKRRIGLGITGLANYLQQKGLRYGSDEAVKETDRIMQFIANEAYRMSAELAAVRGPFPKYERDKFCAAPFVTKLNNGVQALIHQNGIRNGVLLTVAPTGTTSLYAGNVSSGLEPTFAWTYTRNVLNPDGTFKQIRLEDYGHKVFRDRHGDGPLPPYMVTATELTVTEHVVMQAAVQKWIDAAVSKTINCPTEMSFEDFAAVYKLAYELGCKGCTTYRPSGTRGAVLIADTAASAAVSAIPVPIAAPVAASGATSTRARARVLVGKTYKLRWPHADHAYYVTVNDDEDGRPYEIFIASKAEAGSEYLTAITRLVSAILRRPESPVFVLEELQKISSPAGGEWEGGKYIPSLVAKIGVVLEEHFKAAGLLDGGLEVAFSAGHEIPSAHEVCPKCAAPALHRQEGCSICKNCGYSSCG